MTGLEHPEIPLIKPMTEKHAAMLNRICRTNGGGVSIYDTDRSVLKGLVRRHFVQGKAGNDGRIVHTREGITAWRASLTNSEGGGE